MTQPRMQFWFEFASTYSYVAAMRIEKVAAEAGVPLEWKPFLLGPLFTEQQGIKDSPFNVFPIRGRYMWRDMERLCVKYGLPWRRPTAFPRLSVPAARVACLGASESWGPAFVRAVYQANFVDDRNIADPELLVPLLDALGLNGKALVERAGESDAKERLRRNTEEAARAGIFGAPNFIVDGELFFGQDRLDDAIAWYRQRVLGKTG